MKDIISVTTILVLLIFTTTTTCQKNSNGDNINKSVSEMSIYYRSSPTPTPYNYSEHIVMKFKHERKVLDIKYEYDRFSIGDVSEYETEDMVLTDDWSWGGELGVEWYEDFVDITTKLSLYEDEEVPGGDSYEVSIEFDDGEKISGRPKTLNEWETLREELIDAIMQEMGFELPTPVKYAHITDDGNVEILSIELDYAKRNGMGKLFVDGEERDTVEISLEDFREIRNNLKRPIYKPEGKYEELPLKPGHYLQRGIGVWWVSFESGMENPDSNPDAIENLKETFEGIKGRVKVD